MEILEVTSFPGCKASVGLSYTKGSDRPLSLTITEAGMAVIVVHIQM
jgi:hypothetical protein